MRVSENSLNNLGSYQELMIANQYIITIWRNTNED